MNTIPSFYCNEQYSLREIVFPPNIQTIGTCAFRNCTNLEMMNLSQYLQLTKLDNNAFLNAWSLQDFVFPPNIKEISLCVFQNCTSLTRLDLSNCHQLTKLGSYAFSDCFSLHEIILPPNIDEIEPSVFNNCTSLVSIRIPESVKEIGKNSFLGCSQLEQVIFEGDPLIDGCAFDDCPRLSRKIFSQKRHSGFIYGKYSELKGILKFEQQQGGTCGIRLEDFLDDSNIVVLPCGHAFFEEEFHEWILRRKICPSCRVELK